MIPSIEEINWPSYATMSEAQVSLNDMGDKTITAKVKIDGDIAPDFSQDWVVKFKGERYIHPLRNPQATKENASRQSVIDMTFYHWAVYELKRHFFVELAHTTAGTAMADKYVASLSLNLGDFVTAFDNVLQFYYGGAIRAQLNPSFGYPSTPTVVAISYTKIWDLLQKFYELYGVRWRIVADTSDASKAIIKIGYDTQELSHIFEYGFEGGLLKYEQQVQSGDIANQLLGRGGETNLPAYYFKKAPEGSTFKTDYDYIPELKDIYFANLRDINFRYYVQGWKDKHYKYDPATGVISDAGTHLQGVRRYAVGEHWAYDKGFLDDKFDYVEYVKDDDSIAKYGVIESALSDDDDIYPTIQNRIKVGVGRVDETVDIEQVESDDVESAVAEDAVLVSRPDMTASIMITLKGNYYSTTLTSEPFSIPLGKTASVAVIPRVTGRSLMADGSWVDIQESLITLDHAVLNAVDQNTGDVVEGATNLLGGHTYRIVYNAKVKIQSTYEVTPQQMWVTLSLTNIKVSIASPADNLWTNAFKIWVKDIWGSVREDGETDSQFAQRVWQPILGDRLGNEAKVVFSDGNLGVSEDYEFTILDYAYDDTKQISLDADGRVVAAGSPAAVDIYQSMWCLTLGKSDADLESIGLYVPSTKRNGSAGDHFFFIGIDMPHDYVLWAEELLNNVKTDALDKVKDIIPAKVVTLDKVRAHTMLGDEAATFAEQLDAGAAIRIADKRFIDDVYVTVYVQSMTYNYNGGLLPDIEIVLTNEVTPVMSTTATLQGSVEALHAQIVGLGNVEAVVRAVGDKLYLRKDGIADRSQSNTEFLGLVTSENFRQGRIGGAGWGIYRDANGHTIFEADRMVLRESLDVTSLVIHQTEWVGGSYIESAAGMTCTKVIPGKNASGQVVTYKCYFDTKGGSVQNLFKVHDVAYSQMTDPANTEVLKYYKREVVAIGEDYITLDAQTHVDGAGVPQKGDVIIQYGSYTDANRRYVKVRDVVGGGYERFIEGLDSVTAQGTEYYFAGKEIGQNGALTSYRLFIGDRNNDYMEWRDGALNIKGKLTISGKNELVEDYIDGAVEGAWFPNLAQGTQDIFRVAAYQLYGGNNMTFDMYGCAGLAGGDDFVVSCDIMFDCTFRTDSPDYEGSAFVWLQGTKAYGYNVVGRFEKDVVRREWMHYVWRGKMPATNGDGNPILATDVGGFYLRADGLFRGVGSNWSIFVKNFMVVKGEKEVVWNSGDTNVANDYDYLTKALQQNTSIDGGLIQTAAVRLGETKGGAFTPKAGVNGVYYPDRVGGGLAFVGGGDFVDPATASDSDTPATFGVRMDGTMWASNNKVRFTKDAVELGNNIQVDDDEFRMTDDTNNVVLSITNRALTTTDAEVVTPWTGAASNVNAEHKFKIRQVSSGANKGVAYHSVMSATTTVLSEELTNTTGPQRVSLRSLQVMLPSVARTNTYGAYNLDIVPPELYFDIIVNGTRRIHHRIPLKESSAGDYMTEANAYGYRWRWQTLTYQLLAPTTFVINDGGSLIMRVAWTDAGLSDTSTLLSTTTGTLIRTHEFKQSSDGAGRNQLIIGNNGFIANNRTGTTNGYVLSVPGLFQVQMGDVVFKVDSSGIAGSTNGGGAWTTILGTA